MNSNILTTDSLLLQREKVKMLEFLPNPSRRVLGVSTVPTGTQIAVSGNQCLVVQLDGTLKITKDGVTTTSSIKDVVGVSIEPGYNELMVPVLQNLRSIVGTKQSICRTMEVQ